MRGLIAMLIALLSYVLTSCDVFVHDSGPPDTVVVDHNNPPSSTTVIEHDSTPPAPAPDVNVHVDNGGGK